MLDPRIYRMGLVPVVLAAIVLAFSLTSQPGPLSTTLAPDAYSGAATYATLSSLAREFPRRLPGSPADRRLAGLVAGQLRANQFAVTRTSFRAITARGQRSLESVIGIRAGQDNGSIVVVAHRDALGSPAAAQLSGTAVLLSLAHVLGGETLQHTVVLASTTGSVGGAGAQELARTLPQPVDAVIVLGDVAGTAVREPVVVPWSDGQQVAPPLLRNTVGAALESQAGLAAGGTSLLAQLAHLTLPMAPTEQAPLVSSRDPAVLVSVTGDRAPAADASISQEQITNIGRAVVQAVNALDGGGAVPASSSYLTFSGKTVPAWAIRLLALALILPVLLASIDGVARARRRGYSVLRWTAWVLAGAVPFVTVALIIRAADSLGAISGPTPLPLDAGTIHLHGGEQGFLAAMACLVGVGFVWLRWLVRRGEVRTGSGVIPPYGDGAAAGVLLVLCLVAVALWVVNPFAALLVVPALHLWMWVVVPDVKLPLPGTIVLVLAGLALPVLVAVQYALVLGLNPLQAAWSWVLLLGGGGFGLASAVAWSLFLGCAGSVVAIAGRAARQPGPEPLPVTIRGPVTYAGPGSLGGTRSAMRR